MCQECDARAKLLFCWSKPIAFSRFRSVANRSDLIVLWCGKEYIYTDNVIDCHLELRISYGSGMHFSHFVVVLILSRTSQRGKVFYSLNHSSHCSPFHSLLYIPMISIAKMATTHWEYRALSHLRRKTRPLQANYSKQNIHMSRPCPH